MRAPDTLLRSDIPGFPHYQGKVRDTYDLRDGTMLVVASDRISTFDVRHPNGIPEKGKILTAMSLFWFRKLAELVPDIRNHLLETDASKYGHGLDAYRDQLEGRSMLVKKVDIVPMECIARGYLIGSGWKEYKEQGTVGFQEVPRDIPLAGKLPVPLFTPSTKVVTGHDINISLPEAETLVGAEVAARLRDMTLRVYEAAARWSDDRDIILADTKLEFGKDAKGELILADEVLTPDSSRFWPKDSYVPGRNPPSFDKQYVRDWAEGSGWNKEDPAPVLPEEVVARTTAKYVEAYERLTNEKWR